MYTRMYLHVVVLPSVQFWSYIYSYIYNAACCPSTVTGFGSCHNAWTAAHAA